MGVCASNEDIAHENFRNAMSHDYSSRPEPREPWDKSFSPMTREELMQKRQEFWETRIDGRSEMWQAIRLAAESDDDTTAKVILQSAGLSPYDIDRPDYCFCYDERGFRYEVPMYILHEPRNLVVATPDVVVSEEEKQKAEQDLTIKIRLSTGTDIQYAGKGQDTILHLKQFVEKEKGIAPDRQKAIFQGKLLHDSATLAHCRISNNVVLQVMVRPTG